MTAHTDTPAGTVAHFSALLQDGHLDALLGLYEDGATLVAEPGRAVNGHAAIRRELAQLVALNPRMTGKIERILQAGDTALVANRWQLRGTAPDGTAVELGGLSADVLRRRPDGSWGVLIDDPYGTAGVISKDTASG